MTSIKSVILEVADPSSARDFIAQAFGIDGEVSVCASEAPTTGFRWFTLSLVVAQPGTVDSLLATAVEAGATTLKAATKSTWGYGGVVQAPDGTIWKVATSNKKDTSPASRKIDEIVLLLASANVSATKQFYIEQGLVVEKSFLSKYVLFDSPPGSVKLALYGRRALAKDAGVAPEGTGSHRILISSDAGTFSDPDGFLWETAPCVQEHAASSGGKQ